MLNLTPEKVAEIQERAAKATDGEWKVSGATIIWSPQAKANIAAVSELRTSNVVGYSEVSHSSEDFYEACDNARFIAESRTAVPNLTEDWQELHAALEAKDALIQELRAFIEAREWEHSCFCVDGQLYGEDTCLSCMVIAILGKSK